MVKGSKGQSHFDQKGSGLLVVAVLGLMGSVSIMGSSGNQISWFLGATLLAIGILSVIFFWRRTRTVKDPVIEPEILAERPFLAANGYNITSRLSHRSFDSNTALRSFNLRSVHFGQWICSNPHAPLALCWPPSLPACL